MGSLKMQNMLRTYASIHLRRQVKDKPLRAALTPSFHPGCKRLLISNTWFPSLLRPNVTLVTQAVTGIRPEGVVSQGNLYPCDVIIWGTGFKAAELVTPMRVLGEATAGEASPPELSALWRSQPAASRLGITVAGFPNLFLVGGPNTGLGHNSLIFMIEAQVHYIVGALGFLQRSSKTTLRLRPVAQADDYAQVQEKMKGTVWVSGCHSWYQNASGRIDTLWPDFTWRYWWNTRRFDATSYLATGA